MSSRKAARRSRRAVSTLTATTSKFLSPASACSPSSDGISARHGAHHVAHRFRSTALPRKSDTVVFPPSRRSKASGIASRGSAVTWSAATSPLASGASLAAIDFAEAGQEPSTLPVGASVPYRTAAATAASATSATARRGKRPRCEFSGFVIPLNPGSFMSNAMWGGRFSGGPAAVMEEINASIDFDRKLAAQDIAGSQAHVAMLAKQGMIEAAEAEAIAKGLAEVKGEIEAGTFAFSRALEDIHMNVESRLAEIVGPAAGRLHTARSRNDQIAVDFRLWVRDTIDALMAEIAALQRALAARAVENAELVMPGFTHLQSAQPVTFGHHLLAYVEMLGRDAGRFQDARRRLNECPLGAAALAGTSFPIDRAMTAKALGFDRPTANSLDSVADRDFALEALAAAAIAATHLSRFAEEIVLWTTPQFGFVRLSDAFSTGSSIMPQKRNPDAAELVRAKTGRVVGALVGLLTVMKGLPLAYSKDMQEDKEGLFDALGTLSLCLSAMTGMVEDLTPDARRMKAAAGAGYATATDLADWLVRTLRMPFREAHHVTGRIVALAAERGVGLERLSLDEMQSIEPRITEAALGVLDVESSVKSRTSYGGTAPANVRRQARAWLKRLERDESEARRP